MATPVKMLRLSKGMDIGQVVRWLKSPGDQVSEGETLLEVESEKAIVELQAPASGVLLKILVEPGQEVPVGTELGWVGEPDEAVPQEAKLPSATPLQAEGDSAPANSSKPAPRSDQSQGTSAGDQKVKASPALRRLASRHGISLETVQGTGPGGRITKEDLQRAIDLQET